MSIFNPLAMPKEERTKALLLSAYFFLIVAAFWIQKPLRTSHFIKAVGVANIPWAKLGTALLIIPVMMAYSAGVRRLARGYAALTCSLFFLCTSIAFWRLFSGPAPDWAHYIYYFYIDIYITVMLAAFWSLAHAVSRPSTARQTYALVGAGGILGGALGSALTGALVKVVGTPALLLVSAAIMVLLAGISVVLSRLCALPVPPPDTDSVLRSAVSGARLTLRDPYLLSIAGTVACYEVVSNIVDYQFDAAAAAAYSGVGDLTAFMARLSAANIGVSVVLQIFLTTFILRRFGPRAGILVLPVLLGLGNAAFFAIPTMAAASFLFSCDSAIHYSINQTSKEILYTPTDEATKYQAKAFIDMFIFRAAKGFSAVLILLSNARLTGTGLGTRALSLIALVFVAAWAVMADRAGDRFNDLSAVPANDSLDDEPGRV